jgi:hypothetical protein
VPVVPEVFVDAVLPPLVVECVLPVLPTVVVAVVEPEPLRPVDEPLLDPRLVAPDVLAVVPPQAKSGAARAVSRAARRSDMAGDLEARGARPEGQQARAMP